MQPAASDKPDGLPSAIRVAVVTNIPAPYRVPVYNCLANESRIDLQVFYAARKEPDRTWDLPPLHHRHMFLRERVVQNQKGRFLHNNPDIVPALNKFDPDVVITTGYNLTHLYAFAFSLLRRRQHVAMTDGTPQSEADVSWLHRAARRVVIKRSGAFVVASQAGRSLFTKYGAPEDRILKSPLCANMAVNWREVDPCRPGLDFLFSGRLVDVKNPLFALDVACAAGQRLGRRTRLAILGGGPLERPLRQRAADLSDQVEVSIVGNIRQTELPAWFASARVFLFPTSWDPWGVVANEACLAGIPVIVSPNAGSAGELIVDGRNGFVRPLELSRWADAAVALLTDSAMHARFSDEARKQVREYSFENAAKGIADAAMMACGNADRFRRLPAGKAGAHR
jgi:glycosyltransferase involved in cell wall biosynthesis